MIANGVKGYNSDDDENEDEDNLKKRQ